MGMMSAHKVVAALLELSALDKTDWTASIRQVLLVGADVLGVARTSYWTVVDTPRSLRCVLGYFLPTGGFDRGRIIAENEAPRFFAAVGQGSVLEIDDAATDRRVAELGDYREQRQIGALLDVPVYCRGKLVGVLCHE